MSMEHGVSASTSKTAHGAHGAHGYGKTAAGAAGGFASVLSSLGAEEDTLTGFEGTGFLQLEKSHPQAVVPGVAESATLTAPTGVDVEPDLGRDAADLTGKDGLDAAQAGDVPGAVLGAEDPAQTAAAAAALAALGLDLEGVATQGDAANDATAARLALAGAAGPMASATGSHVPLAAGAKAALPGSTVGLANGRAAALTDRQGGKTVAKDAENATATTTMGRQSGVALQTTVETPGLQRQLGQRNVSARAEAAKADAARGGKGEDVAARLGWRSEAAAQATQAAVAAGGQQAAMAQGELGGGRFGFGERGEEGARVTLHEFSAIGAVSTGGASGASLDPATLAQPVQAGSDAGLSTETQVAEQVNYWIGRGARNAEISVEGLAENPIHITIAMRGQEASVVFRAEQVETRQVLQDAMSHLRELLEREGLTLGDVSVDHSDTGWQGGSQASAQAREHAANRMRQGVLSGQEDAAAPAQGASRTLPLPAGRTLDLFV